MKRDIIFINSMHSLIYTCNAQAFIIINIFIFFSEQSIFRYMNLKHSKYIKTHNKSFSGL